MEEKKGIYRTHEVIREQERWSEKRIRPSENHRGHQRTIGPSENRK
jgi:hypothetical protein